MAETPETPTVGGSCPTCGTFCVVLADESVPGKATYQPLRPAVWPEPGAPAPAKKPPLSAPSPKGREEREDDALLEYLHRDCSNERLAYAVEHVAREAHEKGHHATEITLKEVARRLRAHSPEEPDEKYSVGEILDALFHAEEAWSPNRPASLASLVVSRLRAPIGQPLDPEKGERDD